MARDGLFYGRGLLRSTTCQLEVLLTNAATDRADRTYSTDPCAVIAVLTWRGYETTRSCLASLSRLAAWPVPTLVIDNDSGTGEAERLAREFGPPVSALTLASNGGVPAGYNAGMTWAASQAATHVLLLNNDTLVEDPDLLDRLLAAAAPDIAAVGPMTREADGSIFSLGGSLNWTIAEGIQLRRPPEGSSGPYEVEWLDGSCLLVSLGSARRIGGFAPEYFMYWEELDWCIRARRAGYRCVVEPRASIKHLRATFSPTWMVRRLMLRNAILFMRRNGSARQNATTLAYLLVCRAPALLIRKAWPPTDLAIALRTIAHAVSWNILDAARRGRWRYPATGPSIEPDLSRAIGPTRTEATS
jgi:hypothetical protein